jgi:multidrug efflux pump subunit AcrA (membrane-fusion protein)
MFHFSILLTTLLSADSGAIEISSAVIKVSEEVAVPARDPGVLAKIEVKEGQLVEEGETLARLLDTDIRLAVDRARLESEIALRKFKNDADILYAKKSTEVARSELARSLDTNTKFPKTVSNTELDRQRLLVEQGELQIKQAEHQRDVAGLTHEISENQHQTARDQLDRRTIIAPLRGMVVEVLRRRGEWVQPGDTIVRIVRLDRLRAEGFLPARHATLDLVGSKVRLRLSPAEGNPAAEKPRELPGRILFVSPEIDPLNSQVRVWAEVENPDLQLRPGMTATLTIEK